MIELTMQTKLTLRLEDSAIANAKLYAQARDTSVSQLVADYFAQLSAPPSKTSARTKQLPAAPLIPAKSTTQRLRGLLTQKKSGATSGEITMADENDYRRYLDEKYR